MKNFVFIAFLIITLTFPDIVFATVVINEIMPNPSSGDDWIELYKTDQTEIDLSGWKIEDSTSVAKTFSDGTKIASASSYYQVMLSNRLNNGGDTVKLKDNNGNIINETTYSSNPGEGITLGRFPDGSSNWGILTSSTPNSSNSSLVPSSTPTPSITPTYTPTPKTNDTSTPKPNTPTNTPIPSATPTPNRILSPTPTPKITKTVTPTKAPNPTVPLTPTPTPTEKAGSVLGEQDNASTPSAGNQNKRGWIIVSILISLGFICIGIAVFLSFKTVARKRKFLELERDRFS
ncbi:hypothetical protein A2960_00415 [Candidatus Gottesmanbacteria bacterium RIFCSPLOWO2_01_FULL_39_12b]|uniref:LTD domain-containing protein n=1 Tax=Candidatus Gottesmanbacteria bacterium RIFCSPLOWO2_01_FULL_39_12b TaxID=1798388 RepID=A0A1F6APJ3_9BACT|nr:MAG: hypothetical protein A2960_00415 [Candidatus Gottesmanbacteria bacterium RIFCSPLOWO2_01_FULL_39_12b]